MVNIRDHLVGLIQSTTTSSGHRDREELIDVTDIEEDLDEEDEDEDEDDDDDDDDGTDAADDDDDEDDIDIDDDDLDLDELERMHTATEAIPFSYCHRSIANHHRNDDVDNELFSPGDETMDCCGAGGTGQPTTLMMPSYQRLNGVAASTAVPSTPAHIAEPASQRIRRYAQLSGRMLFLCCASFALLITFAVYMEQLSASNAQLRALQAAATAAVQQQRRQGLLRQTVDVASGGGGDEDGGSVFVVDDDDDGNNDEDGVDYAYDESVVVPVRLNGLGSLCFVNGVVFYGLCVAAAVAAWLGQWWRRDGIQLLRFPLPPNRLISVASVAGIAGAGIFICSYQRVVCHLQDPLKGFCLAFGIVFYFLCCKKVMGLQKIFAAMTAVVGLLIAVDYGLCDSFRCRGVDVPIAEAANVGGAQQSMTALPTTTGWQSRAVWTMGYIVALALWSLQWALLEAEVVTTFQTTPQTTHKTGHHLLATVSRLVEQDRHADNMANVASMKTAKCRNQLNAKNRKPKAILVAAWLHGLASLATLTTALVDIVPATGPPSSINQFIYDTFETLMCHGNLCRHYHHHHHTDGHSIGNIPTMTGVWLKAEDHHNHNETANRKQLNRKRRSMDFATTTSKRLVDGRLHELVINGTVHLVAVTDRHHHSVGGPPTVAGMSVGNNSTSIGNSSSSSSSSSASTRSSAPVNSNSSQTSSTTMTPRKINSERYWKRYKERYVKRKKIATPSSTSSSFDIPSAADESPLPLPARNGTPKGRQQQQLPVDVHHQQHAAGSDATTSNAIDAETVSDFTLNWPIMRMALLFSLVYAVFLVCTVQFLLDTESAVFTVAVQSLALPLAGLFWSTFELTITAEHIATIIWAPEITGELICSVLGTPIVVLGLCLFGAAHMEDVALKQRTHDAVTS